MRRSIATVSLSGTLRTKLDAVAAARFDAIELFEADFINFSGDARTLRGIADDLGLGIDLYQPFRDFEGMPEAQFRQSLDRAERKFDLMQTLGAPLVLVCSNTSPLSVGDPERAAAQLHELAERAARRNLRVGFEALAWGRWTKLYSEAWAIVQRAAHPHLGLILDSFHTLSLGDDPAGIAAIPGEKIFFVQMADAPRLSMDVLQWARHHRNFPGQGQFDCEGFFEQALRAGYAGTLSLEIFNDVFRSTPNRRTALDAMRSLLYLESRVRARLERAAGAEAAIMSIDAGPSGRTDAVRGDPGVERVVMEAVDTNAGRQAAERAPGPAPGRSQASPGSLGGPVGAPTGRGAVTPALDRVELFAPPAATPFGGFAFLEFGVDAAAADALGALLARFGFVRHGRHRSKNAVLYRQGAIRLVLNSEPGSDAMARFAEQGPSVGTLGLAAADPRRAANRAVALLSARRDSPRGADELELPAIVAPGGTIVQFVPDGQTPDADFVAEAPVEHAPSGCGLTTIDHVAMGLANEQFDTWMLFTRAVLGLTPGDSLELADPFGLIRSSGISNDDRSLRFVLNVSLSDRTRTARQVSASGRSGGSVHHIAFACADIFEAMAQLRARGARFVPISANYYDDLIARLGLDEPLVRRMQAHDILYDASATGRYFHAYSETFDNRFFFEVVQRDQYDAYGAVNAPARLASQEERRD